MEIYGIISYIASLSVQRYLENIFNKQIELHHLVGNHLFKVVLETPEQCVKSVQS